MRTLDSEATTARAAPLTDRSCGAAVAWLVPCARLALVALLAAAAACGRNAAGPAVPQPVATMTMRPQPTSLTQDYPAQLEAANTVEIRPQVG
ncbi:MAG TPA: hypothetical protein VKG05_11395, partial [Steroidobacteraceae bacterium]|nr:hypothetical protein [Steroidobacteraceae bacterium]